MYIKPHYGNTPEKEENGLDFKCCLNLSYLYIYQLMLIISVTDHYILLFDCESASLKLILGPVLQHPNTGKAETGLFKWQGLLLSSLPG